MINLDGAVPPLRKEHMPLFHRIYMRELRRVCGGGYAGLDDMARFGFAFRRHVATTSSHAFRDSRRPSRSRHFIP